MAFLFHALNQADGVDAIARVAGVGPMVSRGLTLDQMGIFTPGQTTVT